LQLSGWNVDVLRPDLHRSYISCSWLGLRAVLRRPDRWLTLKYRKRQRRSSDAFRVKTYNSDRWFQTRPEKKNSSSVRIEIKQYKLSRTVGDRTRTEQRRPADGPPQQPATEDQPEKSTEVELRIERFAGRKS
jgi:hypothetical protein